jgi:Flp pilus assembly protein TadG
MMETSAKTPAGSAMSSRSPQHRGILRSQSGQSLLEVALLTPLLLTLLLGTIDLGRYGYAGILVGNAARAGAAYGAQSLTLSVNPTGIQDAANNDYNKFQVNGQNVSTLTVSSSVSCGCDSGGTVTPAACSTTINPSAGKCGSGHWVVMVSVTATDTFNALFKYPGIPSPITISRTATMRVAQQ